MSRYKQIPNYLTYARIAAIPALVLVFALPGPLGMLCSAALFLLAGLTDWLDGHLARKLNALSNVGKFLDPIADKLLVATALLLLVSAHRADVIPSIAILCREILVSGLREFLAEIRVSVPVSRLAKWKTAMQMTAIFLLLLATGGPQWLPASDLGDAMLWLAAALTVVTGYAYMKTGWKHLNG